MLGLILVPFIVLAFVIFIIALATNSRGSHNTGASRMNTGETGGSGTDSTIYSTPYSGDDSAPHHHSSAHHDSGGAHGAHDSSAAALDAGHSGGFDGGGFDAGGSGFDGGAGGGDCAGGGGDCG